MQEEISPYEKLNCIAEAFADIKSTVVVHYKGEVSTRLAGWLAHSLTLANSLE